MTRGEDVERTGPFARARRRYEQARDDYILVFALLLLVIALIAVVPVTGSGGLVITALQTFALLLTLHNAGVRGRRENVARVLAAVPVLAVALALAAGRPLGPFYYVSMLVLLVGTQTAIVVHAVRRRTITADTVMGALCVYLLLGILFATLDAFYASAVAPFFAQSGPHASSDYIYFSFITIETVGYGDLTPAPSVPRILALAEGLFGQLYLVTVISLLVGNLGAQRLKRQSGGPDGAG